MEATALAQSYAASFTELEALKELILNDEVVAAAATACVATVSRGGNFSVVDRLLKNGEERAARHLARQAEHAAAEERQHRPRINKRAGGAGRSKSSDDTSATATSVEDSLMRRGRKSKEKIAAMRAKAKADELESLKGAPTINKVSQRLASRQRSRDGCGRAVPLHERAVLLQDAARQRNAEMRETLAERKMAELTAKPKINAKSRRLAGEQSRAAREAEWKERREAKLDAVRARQRQSEELECRKPRLISRQSEKIMDAKRAQREQAQQRAEEAEARAAHRAPQRAQRAKPQSVAERLMAEGVANEERRKERLRDAEAAMERMHRPTISVHSANLHREGSVSDRLYERAQYEGEQRAMKRWERDVKENHDMKTGQLRFKPVINRKSRALVAKSQARRRAQNARAGMSAGAAPVAVEDRLLERGAEYSQRRVKRERLLERKMTAERDARKIGERSNALASRREPESMLDRCVFCGARLSSCLRSARSMRAARCTLSGDLFSSHDAALVACGVYSSSRLSPPSLLHFFCLLLSGCRSRSALCAHRRLRR